MTTPDVGDAITACTAFMVRSSGSSHVGFLAALLARLPGQTDCQQLARAHATWLPIWQFNAMTHTCSLWKYSTLEDSVPHQCFTWTGISSLEHAQDVLAQFHVSLGHWHPHSSVAHTRLPALHSQCTSVHCVAVIVTSIPASSNSAPALYIGAVDVNCLFHACGRLSWYVWSHHKRDANTVMCSGACDCHKL